jgi:cysteine synthase A
LTYRRSETILQKTQSSNQSTVLDLIGNTPLVSLSRIAGDRGYILAKAEFMQPGGSVKDRPAKKIIELAYEKARLIPGQPVIEMTSGNMGAGLAVVCSAFGNPFTAVMSAGNSIERVRMLEGLGATVVRIPQVEGILGHVTGKDIEAAASAARDLAYQLGAYYVDQFNNPGSTLAHEQNTGPEIWRQTEGELDAFVAMVGSGGTFVGSSRFLKRTNDSVLCVAVEPKGAAILAGKTVTRSMHVMQGAGYSIVPPLWDPAVADCFHEVSSDEAVEMKKRLGSEQGLYVGFSAAANVCAAVQLFDLGIVPRGGTVVTILCDTGLKYS